MKLLSVSPTVTRITSATPAELDLLRKQLSYTNSSVSYMLHQLRKNKWLRREKPDVWKARIEELEAKVHTNLMFEDDNGLWFHTGFIPHIEKIKIETESKVVKPEPKLMPWHNKPTLTPYPYQTSTVDLLINNIHGSAELATGLGKSFIILMLAQRLGLRTVVITPSTSIFGEILESFRHHLGPTVGAYGDGHKKLGYVTVAIAKSLTMVKPGSDVWEHFSKADVVISDEAHLNPSTTNEKVFHHLLANVPYRFFLSATQTRNDGALPLLKCLNGRQVYEKSIAEGIREGYLSKLEFRIVKVSSDDYKSKDAQRMKRHHYLYNSEVIDKTVTAAEALWKSRGEQSLILVEELEQLQLLLKKIKIPVTYVHGNTDAKRLKELGLGKTDLKKEIERFNKGEVPIFIGTRCVSTGTNFYPTHNTFDLQAVASEVAFFQGPIGRSTRLFQPDKCRYFTGKSVPKNVSRIWMFRVEGVQLMEKQLEKRLDMARSTGCSVIE
jgi:superfamily II DNA or RNA helicase